MAKLKVIELSSLIPVPKKVRKPSARQLALIKREATYEAAISRLQLGQAISFEPSEEKLPALRASLQRVIARNARKSELHLAIISGIAYVALEKIPGARGPRRKKAG